MHYRSLILTDADPPSIELSESLLPDHAATEIGGVPVFTSVAP